MPTQDEPKKPEAEKPQQTERLPERRLPERDPQPYRKSEDYNRIRERNDERRTGKE